MEFGIQEIHRPAEDLWKIESVHPIDRKTRNASQQMLKSHSIVAVHGLNGHSLQTWTTKDNICWLSDNKLLPKYIKQARVLVWGYNANTHSTSKSTASSNHILDHAQTLVAQLQADREV